MHNSLKKNALSIIAFSLLTSSAISAMDVSKKELDEKIAFCQSQVPRYNPNDPKRFTQGCIRQFLTYRFKNDCGGSTPAKWEKCNDEMASLLRYTNEQLSKQ